MTRFADGVAVGGRRPAGNPKQRRSSLVYLDYVPPTLDRDGVCASQTTAGAGDLLLNGALVSGGRAVLGTGVGFFGRCVGVYSAADLSAITFTFYGYTVDGDPQIEAITGPDGDPTPATTAGLKAFGSIVRVAASAAVASAVEIGTIDKFGLPAALSDKSQIARCGWADTLAENAATFALADTTSPATATTGDPRGTVIQASSAANGSRRLTVVMVPDLTSNATFYGVKTYGAGLF